MKQYVYCKLHTESEVKVCETEEETINFIVEFFAKYHHQLPFATLKVEFNPFEQ